MRNTLICFYLIARIAFYLILDAIIRKVRAAFKCAGKSVANEELWW